MTPRTTDLVLILAFAAIFTTSCATPPPAPENDPMARENAIFACRTKIQTEKRAHFHKLPALLQRLAGDNQILKEQSRPLSKGEISRAIAKFPLIGDSGGNWGSAKEAHSRTVSTRFSVKSRGGKRVASDPITIGAPENIEIVFGQPGRVYAFPIAQLKRIVDGGLDGTFNGDRLRIRVIDEHHVVIEATSKHGSTPTGFFSNTQYALVRTYLEQSYNEESATQLSDYPVYDMSMDEDVCDQYVDATT